jgi:hypothetical protein
MGFPVRKLHQVCLVIDHQFTFVIKVAIDIIGTMTLVHCSGGGTG